MTLTRSTVFLRIRQLGGLAAGNQSLEGVVQRPSSSPPYRTLQTFSDLGEERHPQKPGKYGDSKVTGNSFNKHLHSISYLALELTNLST